jgi:hypothetical protein
VKRLRLLVAVLLVVPLLGSYSSERYDGAAAPDGIEGTWVRVAAERDGRKVDIIAGTLTFRDGGRLLEETNGAPARPGFAPARCGSRRGRLDFAPGRRAPPRPVGRRQVLGHHALLAPRHRLGIERLPPANHFDREQHVLPVWANRSAMVWRVACRMFVLAP